MLIIVQFGTLITELFLNFLKNLRDDENDYKFGSQGYIDSLTAIEAPCLRIIDGVKIKFLAQEQFLFDEKEKPLQIMPNHQEFMQKPFVDVERTAFP